VENNKEIGTNGNEVLIGGVQIPILLNTNKKFVDDLTSELIKLSFFESGI
jgi:hypothetical protein